MLMRVPGSTTSRSAWSHDPLAISTPRPQSETTVGGVGLHFVLNLMDQLEYAHRDGLFHFER
jgi:hypothetical protein